jgi:hypothetical protein
MKKGDEVADDEDDDAVRTSVSQDQVTATLCTEELFLITQYRKISPHIRKVNHERGKKDKDRHHNTFSRPS